MSFVFLLFVWGIMGKCELFLLMLKIILLWHKVDLCLHSHIYLSSTYTVCAVLLISVSLSQPTSSRIRQQIPSSNSRSSRNSDNDKPFLCKCTFSRPSITSIIAGVY